MGSPLWPWPPEPQSSPRRVSPLLWPEVVARLLEELRLTQESSPTRLCSSVEVLVDLLLPRTWLLPLVTAVMGNRPAGWESVWATTTSMKMILIRWTLLSRLSCSMRTMTPGPSTMTSMIKVAQRNFRKYLVNRDWGWFVIIQKTRGMIGMPNPEEELRLLEEKANATYGEYKAALDVTANLEGQMGNLKDEIAAMTKQLSEEQGNISVYTDRQAKALTMKGEAEVELAQQQKVLASEEASRVELAAEVKSHSGSIGAVKKDIEDVELAITKEIVIIQSKHCKMKLQSKMRSSTN